MAEERIGIEEKNPFSKKPARDGLLWAVHNRKAWVDPERSGCNNQVRGLVRADSQGLSIKDIYPKRNCATFVTSCRI